MRISGLSGHRIYCGLNAMIYANGSECDPVIGDIGEEITSIFADICGLGGNGQCYDE